MKARCIIHLDMDAYFASVEQRDVPIYRGKPLSVCHTDDPSSIRGIVAAASYEARSFGIKAGMSVLEAKRLCPKGVFIRGNYEKYLYSAKQVIELCKRYSDLVEVYSVDEMFIDMTYTRNLFDDMPVVAGNIQKDVRDELGLSASLGVGPNKLVAKMASEFKKPAGITVVSSSELPQILAPLSIDKIVGIGKRMRKHLESMGIVTIGDLASADEQKLKQKFGIVGYYLHQASLGIDNSSVWPGHNGIDIKSFGHSQALGRGVTDTGELTKILLGITEGVTRRMRKKGYVGRTVTLKLGLARTFSFTRSMSLGEFTNFTNRIYLIAKNLLLKEKELILRYPVTLIGVSMSSLREISKGKQISIFDFLYPKELALNEVVDKIKDKYGERIIIRCRLLDWKGEYRAVPQIELTQNS